MLRWLVDLDRAYNCTCFCDVVLVLLDCAGLFGLVVYCLVVL